MTNEEAAYLQRSAYNHTQVSLRANLFDKNDLTRRQLEWCYEKLGFIPLPPARVRDRA